MLSVSLIVSNVGAVILYWQRAVTDSGHDMNTAKSQSFTENFASKTEIV